MNFNNHSNIEGLHAFLGASNYHWINYDKDKLIESFYRNEAKVKGAELHDIAARCISNNIRLAKSNATLNRYVNDAIGYKMVPEQPLYFSPNCFGTADAISFRKKQLRIHDLKTGITPASMSQLKIYAALFCLEYDVDPNDISIELRIYQTNEVFVEEPQKEEIMYIMRKIIDFDKIIEQLKNEEE